MRDVLREEQLSDRERAALQAEIVRLSTETGARASAVAGFLRTLGEREVSLEQLPAKLTEIAARHRALLERLAVLSAASDAAAGTLLEQARAAIDAGDNDRGDRLLSEVEDLDLQAAEAGLARAAAVRAERGDLALARLDYRTAAAHFATAAARVPDSDRRLGYLDRQADALYRQGQEFGDNAALGDAIESYRGLLAERPRERVPLDWATTQNNLGAALRTLGARETGTARLEDVVAAYRAALEEFTRERVPGGQQGHPGATPALVEAPDGCIVVPLTGACDCGRDRGEIAAEVQPERRRVIELEIERKVVEYRTVAGACACGRVHRSAFPGTVAAPVQYGPSVAAPAVYPTQEQLLPYRRTADVPAQVGGIALCAGSVHRAVEQAGHRLEPIAAAVGRALIASPVAHADATGMRVGTDLYRLHVLATAELTACFPHPKRGAEALDAFGLLEQFTGILVHDHWSAYARCDCLHAFCNAHHLREPIALAETIPGRQGWAEDMIALPCEADDITADARRQGLAALSDAALERLQSRYDAIPEVGAQRNPPRQPPPGSRRRVKQSPACNPIKRLRGKRDDVLRFLTDLRVPFDNNQAERDIRMPKLKQKVSGAFRTDTGSGRFTTIRSYLSTLRKQGADIFQALVLTLQGSPPMPKLE